MSEHQRREAQERLIAGLTREAADQGKVLELGWESLRKVWLHPNAPEEQVKDMRWAYFAGAQHLWASILTMLDPEAKETEADMRKMALIHAELEAFAKEITASLPTKGRG